MRAPSAVVAAALACAAMSTASAGAGPAATGPAPEPAGERASPRRPHAIAGPQPPAPPDDSDDDGIQSAPGAPGDGDATFAPAPGEVIVIEERDRRGPGTAATREIDPATIATTPRRSADDLLRLVPGLHVSQHGSEGKGVQMFLRGFDAVHGSDIAVDLAGVPLNEASHIHGHGYVDLGLVIPEVVRSLRGHKSSFELDQGPFATAGSLSFELGVERRGHRVGYEIGTTNRHRLLAVIAPPGQPAASFTAVEALSDDGYGTNRAARRLVAVTQQRFELSGGDAAIEILGAAHAARFGEPGPVPLADVERGAIDHLETYDPLSGGNSRRALAALRAERELGHGALTGQLHVAFRDFHLTENYTGYLLFPDVGDRRAQAHRSISAGLSGRAARDVGDRVTLLFGAEGLVDRFAQTDDRIDAVGVPWRPVRALSAIQLHGGLFAGARVRGGPVEVETGVRADLVAVSADDLLDDRAGRTGAAVGILSPRLTAGWRLGDTWHLRAGYGRGLRPPEARALIGAAPPPGEMPGATPPPPDFTTSDAVDLGLLARQPGRYTVQLSLFGIWISDEVIFDHAAGTNLQVNATRRLGAEFGAESYPAEWLRLRADLGATSARFTDSGAPVPSAPRLLASAEVGLLHPRGWRAGAQAVYVAPRPLAHGATASATGVVNLLAARQLGRLELSLSIDNALGARWREAEYHYASWFDRSQPRSSLPRIHYVAGRPFGVRAGLTATF